MTSSEGKIQGKKGPIRFEAIVPASIVFALLLVYKILFFDSMLAKGIEWTASYIHGAEVNIEDIDTSVLDGTFTLTGLEVTDKNHPVRNIVKVDEIHFQFLWDALLRAKFVVEKAHIKGAGVYVPREEPGEVFPKEKTVGQPIGEVQNKIIETAGEQNKGNALGDVANVMGGVKTSDQAAQIRGELKSEKRADELSKELESKQKEWQDRVANMKQQDHLKELQAEAKSIKVDKKKPWKSAKEFKRIGNAIKAKLGEFNQVKNDLTNDINKFQGSIGEIDDLAKQDLQDLQKRMNIPSLDSKELAKQVFEKILKEKAAGFYKYIVLGRKYMPNPGEKKAPELIPRKRGEGKTYRFPVTSGYPLFWLKEAMITSKAGGNEYSGDVDGKITDVTTDPVLLGKPAVIHLKGDFPAQNVKGVFAKFILDHTRDVPKETFMAKVSSFPVKGYELSNTESMKFWLASATGTSHFEGVMNGDLLMLDIRNTFGNITYDIDSSNGKTKMFMTKIANGIPKIMLGAKASGPVTNLDWKITSNLASAISDGIRGQIKGEVDDKKRELKQQIDSRLKGKKEKLSEGYAKIKNQISGLLGKKEAEVNQNEQQATNATKTGEGDSSDKKGLLKGLKKKLF